MIISSSLPATPVVLPPLLKLPTSLFLKMWEYLTPVDMGRACGTRRLILAVNDLFLKKKPEIVKEQERLKILYLQKRLTVARDFLPIDRTVLLTGRVGEQFIVRSAGEFFFFLYDRSRLKIFNPHTKKSHIVNLKGKVETFEVCGSSLFLTNQSEMRRVEIDELLRHKVFNLSPSPVVSDPSPLSVVPQNRSCDRVALDQFSERIECVPVVCVKDGLIAIAHKKHVEIKDLNAENKRHLPMANVRQIEILKSHILLLSEEGCELWARDTFFSKPADKLSPVYKRSRDLTTDEPPFKFATWIASSQKVVVTYRDFIAYGTLRPKGSCGFVYDLSTRTSVSLGKRYRGNRSHYVVNAIVSIGNQLFGALPHLSKWDTASGTALPYPKFFHGAISDIDQIEDSLLTAESRRIIVQSTNPNKPVTIIERSPNLLLCIEPRAPRLVRWHRFSGQNFRFAIVETRADNEVCLTVYDLFRNRPLPPAPPAPQT